MIDRGVVVQDHDLAKHYLEKIGFYRLAGYSLPFQKGGTGADRHDCKVPVEFQTILDRYIFDRKFRLLLMDAIERIEVSIRASFSNTIAITHGSHWYLDASLFEPEPQFDHAKSMSELRRQIGHSGATPEQMARRDVFIRHYFSTYNDPPTPPSWMVFEAVSFGFVSTLFEGLYKSHTIAICQPLKVPHEVLSSWFHAISYVRNLCAHHSRVWNRTLTIKPTIARKHKEKFNGNTKIYGVLVVLQIMLEQVAPDNNWAERLAELIGEYPEIPLANMGFPEDWKSYSFWQLQE
jgi:abortive infection bacteriophage resistance protein